VRQVPQTREVTPPLCPKCGERARVAIVLKARVRCVLKADGSLGEVLSCSREQAARIGYECGGGHTWVD